MIRGLILLRINENIKITAINGSHDGRLSQNYVVHCNAILTVFRLILWKV